MRKKFLIFFTLISALFLAACQSNTERYGEPLIFTTGTTTGVFYSLGAGLSTMWTKDLEKRVASQASNGSVENLNLMRKKEANIAFTTVNIAYEAYNGEGSFKDRKYEGVRILGNLYPNISHIIVKNNDKFKTIEDLKGTRFVYGAAGSSTEFETRLVMESHGIQDKDIRPNYVGFTEATDLLRNGQVEGANIYSGIPAAAATELITTVDTKILSFSKEAVKEMTEKYPWNFEYTIKANTYDDQPQDILTVGQYSTIVVDESVSDETIYELTKLLWENTDTLAGSYSVAKQFDAENAVKGTADVPLHPGAERYYREIGVLN